MNIYLHRMYHVTLCLNEPDRVEPAVSSKDNDIVGPSMDFQVRVVVGDTSDHTSPLSP